MPISSLVRKTQKLSIDSSSSKTRDKLQGVMRNGITFVPRSLAQLKDMKLNRLERQVLKIDPQRQQANKSFAFVETMMRKEGSSANSVMDYVNDNEPNIEKVIFILMNKSVQQHDSATWGKLSDRAKMDVAQTAFNYLATFFELTADEAKDAKSFCFTGLTPAHLDSMKAHYESDRGHTLREIKENEQSGIHLLVESTNPDYNCISNSLGRRDIFVWDQIKPGDHEDFSLQEFDQFYKAQGYKPVKGPINPDLKNSVIAFARFSANDQLELNHAGRIDDKGFWSSKQGKAGLLVMPSAEADVSETFGYPVRQYIKA